MQNFKKYLNKFLETICSVLLSVMLLLVLWQVFTRTVLNNPSTVTEEIVRFSLVWLSMLAGAYSVGRNAHVVVTFIQDKFSRKFRFWIAQGIHVFFMLFSASVLIYGGIRGVMISVAQTSPSLGLSMAVVFLAVPVSGVFFFLYSLINLIDLRSVGELVDENTRNELEKDVNNRGV